MYTCGPTVYQHSHLGNLRTYIFQDLVKRTLLIMEYRVKQVINITDVGHLTSDADTGEDKIEQEARKKNKSAHTIARFYEQEFKKDIKALNILQPDAFPRASEHIKEQITLIKQLQQKGYTYKTNDGIYFNTRTFKKYGILAGMNVKGVKAGARVSIKDKKSINDFALWKFSPSLESGRKRQMEWKSPWGTGFPGWHIECSAMSMKYLGDSFDIHIGGIDHVPIHHTNEIAQSEAATGKQFVRYWLHPNLLMLKEKNKIRMGKSKGNAVLLKDLTAYGYSPLDFRYLTLTVHWRSPLLFHLEALDAARAARLGLIAYLKEAPAGKAQHIHKQKIQSCLENNLHTPKALAHIWKLIHRNEATKDLLLWADHVFGLSLYKESKKTLRIPKKIRELAKERESLRKRKQWKEADKIRSVIEKMGWSLRDTKKGYHIRAGSITIENVKRFHKI